MYLFQFDIKNLDLSLLILGLYIDKQGVEPKSGRELNEVTRVDEDYF